VNPSTELARAVVTALVRARVTDVVVAPGSRNAPLSFAVHDAARAGLVRLHTRIDERSAAFLALGLTKGGVRAAAMCTSGTAVANLHPAVLEAAHSGTALVVVTADRPARLRGTGANQVTDQVGIFGPLIETHDIASPDDLDLQRLWSGDLPTHLNVQFDEPLTPPGPWEPGRVEPMREWERPVPLLLSTLETGVDAPRTVVVAGDGAGREARQLAEAGGWPVFAEPSSGSRTGENAIRAYRLLLDTELGRSIERAVVFGHPTLTRPVSRLLVRENVSVLQGPVAGVWPAPAYPVAGRFHSKPTAVGEPDLAWLDAWREADRSVSRQVDALLAERGELTPYGVAGAVSRALPPGGQLVVGPSNPIRDLDLMAVPYEVGGRRKVIANRGLAGIDGVVSTAIGAALGRAHSSRTIALMGDITFLHDSNGLILGPDEPRPDLTVVVVNDDGGAIFATLEQGADEYAASFERLFATPHGVSLEQLCAATRTPHWRVASLPELEQALASPNGGIEVIEAVVRRDNRRDLDEAIRALRP